MNVNTNDLISVSEASQLGVSKLISNASEGRAQVVIKNNKVVAAVIGTAAMEQLQKLDELEADLRILSIALARTVTDSGRRYSLSTVAHKLDIDLDLVDDEND
ncbi:MAG: hypothetical protein ACRDPW_01460 [Mycobacteriales bacterium]